MPLLAAAAVGGRRFLVDLSATAPSTDNWQLHHGESNSSGETHSWSSWSRDDKNQVFFVAFVVALVLAAVFCCVIRIFCRRQHHHDDMEQDASSDVVGPWRVHNGGADGAPPPWQQQEQQQPPTSGDGGNAPPPWQQLQPTSGDGGDAQQSNSCGGEGGIPPRRGRGRGRRPQPPPVVTEVPTADVELTCVPPPANVEQDTSGSWSMYNYGAGSVSSSAPPPWHQQEQQQPAIWDGGHAPQINSGGQGGRPQWQQQAPPVVAEVPPTNVVPTWPVPGDTSSNVRGAWSMYNYNAGGVRFNGGGPWSMYNYNAGGVSSSALPTWQHQQQPASWNVGDAPQINSSDQGGRPQWWQQPPPVMAEVPPANVEPTWVPAGTSDNVRGQWGMYNYNAGGVNFSAPPPWQHQQHPAIWNGGQGGVPQWPRPPAVTEEPAADVAVTWAPGAYYVVHDPSRDVCGPPWCRIVYNYGAGGVNAPLLLMQQQQPAGWNASYAQGSNSGGGGESGIPPRQQQPPAPAVAAMPAAADLRLGMVVLALVVLARRLALVEAAAPPATVAEEEEIAPEPEEEIAPVMSMPMPTVRRRFSTANGWVNGTCTVCQTEMVDDNIVRVLTGCSHYFHSVCIKRWLRQNPTCPICRAPAIPVPVRGRGRGRRNTQT